MGVVNEVVGPQYPPPPLMLNFSYPVPPSFRAVPIEIVWGAVNEVVEPQYSPNMNLFLTQYPLYKNYIELYSKPIFAPQK